MHVIQNRFGLYLISNVALSIAAPFGIWLAVEQWHFPASLATAAILAAVFLLRYGVMAQLGLLKIGGTKPHTAVRVDDQG